MSNTTPESAGPDIEKYARSLQSTLEGILDRPVPTFHALALALLGFEMSIRQETKQGVYQGLERLQTALSEAEREARVEQEQAMADILNAHESELPNVRGQFALKKRALDQKAASLRDQTRTLTEQNAQIEREITSADKIRQALAELGEIVNHLPLSGPTISLLSKLIAPPAAPTLDDFLIQTRKGVIEQKTRSISSPLSPGSTIVEVARVKPGRKPSTATSPTKRFDIESALKLAGVNPDDLSDKPGAPRLWHFVRSLQAFLGPDDSTESRRELLAKVVSGDIPTQELKGPLLWLRNHYSHAESADVPLQTPKPKSKVRNPLTEYLGIVDISLEELNCRPADIGRTLRGYVKDLGANPDDKQLQLQVFLELLSGSGIPELLEKRPILRKIFDLVRAKAATSPTLTTVPETRKESAPPPLPRPSLPTTFAEKSPDEGIKLETLSAAVRTKKGGHLLDAKNVGELTAAVLNTSTKRDHFKGTKVALRRAEQETTIESLNQEIRLLTGLARKRKCLTFGDVLKDPQIAISPEIAQFFQAFPGAPVDSLHFIPNAIRSSKVITIDDLGSTLIANAFGEPAFKSKTKRR